MSLWLSYKKKKKKNAFFTSLKLGTVRYCRKDSLVRCSDPGIQIRTKMSWIPNTGEISLFVLPLL
jgi:hypothetical protein